MKPIFALLAVASLALSACDRATSSTSAVKAASWQAQAFTTVVPTGVSSTGWVAIEPIRANGLVVEVNCSVSVDQVFVTFDNNSVNDAFGGLIPDGTGAWRTAGLTRTFRSVQIQVSNAFAPQSCTYSISAAAEPARIGFNMFGRQLSCVPYTGPVLPCAAPTQAQTDFYNACINAGFETISCNSGCGFACSGNPY